MATTTPEPEPEAEGFQNPDLFYGAATQVGEYLGARHMHKERARLGMATKSLRHQLGEAKRDFGAESVLKAVLQREYRTPRLPANTLLDAISSTMSPADRTNPVRASVATKRYVTDRLAARIRSLVDCPAELRLLNIAAATAAQALGSAGLPTSDRHSTSSPTPRTKASTRAPPTGEAT